jgi:deoxyribodipyrimidine photolyase-related protein
MKTLRLILGDQLSESISSLNDAVPKDDILLCEVIEEASYVKHHPKKIAFIFAAMRHFAVDLSNKGYNVRYVKLDDKFNSGSISAEVARAVKDLNIQFLIVTEPGEYRLKSMMDSWQNSLNIDVEIRADNRFLCSKEEFHNWAKGKKQLRMEYFYREMRKKYNILIEKDGNPTGGNWNYDKQNRKPPPRSLQSPKRIQHKVSEILSEVLSLVTDKFPDNFGSIKPFHLAVTRDDALLELDYFIEQILPNFGDYQDAMVRGEAFLNHSLLSSYINTGLLLPLEVCKKAEDYYFRGKVPLNAAEGFIRQIIGWREYVRGIYWLKMPEYSNLNYLNANKPLPAFYWGKTTQMNCIKEVVQHTQEYAYSHHIQRLMITGNFALIAGIDVKEVQKWYLAVYSDAYEWVEMPNTLGMALFADGGIIASKPYAASGKYINKMSNFCKSCFYNPEDLFSTNACPFNALYWDFMARNKQKLATNQRLNYTYSTLDKFSPDKQKAIMHKADLLIQKMQAGEL